MTQNPTQFTRALVTGASSGIGKALCRLLANQGIDLLITGRNTENLKKLEEELRPKVNVRVIVADLSNREELQMVIEQIREVAPDLVINNAGFGIYGDAIDYPIEQQLEILTINANVPLELMLEAAKALKAQQKIGVILNVASAAAFLSFPTLAIYSAAKSFVVSCSRSLDLELQGSGIRVLAACPGMVDTEFSKRASGKTQPKNRTSMTAEKAAEHIWWQINKRKPCYIFDWKTRWGIYLSFLVPRVLIAKILRKSIVERL